jgi:phosphoribosylanthranilate isomerase
MRDADNIRQVEALSIDWMGFIFWPKSSRFVAEIPSYLPTKCKRVGVFVDASIGDVMTIAEQYQLDIIQLHGQESPSFITQLISHLSRLRNVKIIKAFNIATAYDFEATKRYEDYVDYFLFDTKGKSVGGNGEKFDWSVLSSYKGKTPYLLSGGIGPNDAKRLSSEFSPLNSQFCLGIDLNSRFESSPALKDVAALKCFLDSIK